MTEDEITERRKHLIVQEIGNAANAGWYWLSFADPDKPVGQQFLGVVIVYAHGVITASGQAWERKINPGGECQCVSLGALVPPAGYTNRLLSADEAMALRDLIDTQVD